MSGGDYSDWRRHYTTSTFPPRTCWFLLRWWHRKRRRDDRVAWRAFLHLAGGDVVRAGAKWFEIHHKLGRSLTHWTCPCALIEEGGTDLVTLHTDTYRRFFAR